MQIVSDIAGIEQVVSARQIGASYGDAFLAGIGVGLFSGTAMLSGGSVPSTIRPNGKNRAVYDAGYGLYRKLYEQTKYSNEEIRRYRTDVTRAIQTEKAAATICQHATVRNRFSRQVYPINRATQVLKIPASLIAMFLLIGRMSFSMFETYCFGRAIIFPSCACVILCCR